jgi:hypothetical protein
MRETLPNLRTTPNATDLRPTHYVGGTLTLYIFASFLEFVLRLLFAFVLTLDSFVVSSFLIGCYRQCIGRRVATRSSGILAATSPRLSEYEFALVVFVRFFVPFVRLNETTFALGICRLATATR